MLAAVNANTAAFTRELAIHFNYCSYPLYAGDIRQSCQP